MVFVDRFLTSLLYVLFLHLNEEDERREQRKEEDHFILAHYPTDQDRLLFSFQYRGHSRSLIVKILLDQI